MVPPSEHGNEWSRTRSHQRPRQCTIAATLFLRNASGDQSAACKGNAHSTLHTGRET